MPGVIIAYAPAAAAVPTMSQSATFLLAGLTAVVGAVALRRRGAGAASRVLALVLAAGTAAALGTGGHALMPSARATPLRDGFTNPAGATLTYDDTLNAADTWNGLGSLPSSGGTTCGSSTGTLSNSSGVPLQINSVSVALSSLPNWSVDTADSDYTLAITGVSAPQCVAGSTLSPGQSCQVILATGMC